MGKRASRRFTSYAPGILHRTPSYIPHATNTSRLGPDWDKAAWTKHTHRTYATLHLNGLKLMPSGAIAGTLLSYLLQSELILQGHARVIIAECSLVDGRENTTASDSSGPGVIGHQHCSVWPPLTKHGHANTSIFLITSKLRTDLEAR